jgi:hypothetical protein
MQINPVNLLLASLGSALQPQAAQGAQAAKSSNAFAPLEFKPAGATQNASASSAQSFSGGRPGSVVDIKV